jgi:D-alanyl-D-alanine carboxypeptidase (penicillin-binding protein 5/6)
MKRLFALLIAVAVVCLSAITASAIDYGCNVDHVSDAVYLEEMNTGIVVYEYNADERVYPASTTKIMTYIVVAENVEDFDNTMVEITAEALEDLDPESSVMGLASHIGESFSVRDLLYGLMLPSGNDAALVLADYVGGGVDGFVDLMNRKAAQIGCSNTHFVTPHGLHSSQHYTTARELATITKYALQKKDFAEITDTKSYLPDGFYEPIKTTNYLIDESQHNGDYYYPYAKGIKTGYTDEAGRCLVSTAENNGYRYLCVALGADYSFAEDINYAMLDTADLYDWAFDNLSMKTVFDSTNTLQTIPVEYVWGNKMLDLIPASSIEALLPSNYDPALVTTKVECQDMAYAPVAKGDSFGKLTVYYDDLLIGETDIVAAEDVDRQFTNYFLKRVVNAIRNHLILFIVIVVVLIIVILILADNARRKKARAARHRRK